MPPHKLFPSVYRFVTLNYERYSLPKCPFLISACQYIIHRSKVEWTDQFNGAINQLDLMFVSPNTRFKLVP